MLGGNCLTTMLITCSPHQMQYHATSNTLEFADNCKRIKRSAELSEKKLSISNLLMEVVSRPPLCCSISSFAVLNFSRRSVL